jgi:hypothetical protein
MRDINHRIMTPLRMGVGVASKVDNGDCVQVSATPIHCIIVSPKTPSQQIFVVLPHIPHQEALNSTWALSWYTPLATTPSSSLPTL